MGSTFSKKEKQGMIFFGVGIGLLLGRLFIDKKIYKQQKNHQLKTNKSESISQEILKSQTSKIYNLSIQQISEQVKVEYVGDYLSVSTIKQIFENSLDLIKTEYAEITLENRRYARRKSDCQLYQQLVLSYNEQIENLLQQKQIELCKFLRISEEIFQESVLQLMENGYFQEFFKIQAQIRQKLKETIPSTKNLTLDQIQQLLCYRLQILKQKPKDLAQIIQTLSINQETQQLIPLVVNTTLADYCFEVFQIEDEDMIKMMKNGGDFAGQTMWILIAQIELSMYQLIGPITQQKQ